MIGNIAIVRLTPKSRKHSEDIAQMIMSNHANVKTVLFQTSAVSGKFRLRKLQHGAGEKTTSTIHKESKCVFNIDIAKCYFSPRLLHERMRIAQTVKDDEVVVNMFAGVGCYSILIAKKSNARKVYSIDINPVAVEYMKENVRMNRTFGKIVPILGDAKDIVEKRLRHVADRVLMPLPEKALEYLPYALLALKENGGSVHYYDFVHAKKTEDPVEKVKLKVTEKLLTLGAPIDTLYGRVVRETGPNWHQVVLDIQIVEKREPTCITRVDPLNVANSSYL
jgi:tRNA (guanine37-N1)-methyltransferase